MTDLDLIRSQLSEVTTELTQIRRHRTDLLAELATLEPQEQALSTQVTSLQAELQRLEPPAPRPGDVERLAGLTATLSAKLAKLPSGSPTGARVRGQLERLNNESLPVSDRLSLAKSLLGDVSNYYLADRAVWDAAEGANAARLR